MFTQIYNDSERCTEGRPAKDLRTQGTAYSGFPRLAFCLIHPSLEVEEPAIQQYLQG